MKKYFSCIIATFFLCSCFQRIPLGISNEYVSQAKGNGYNINHIKDPNIQ